MEAIKSAGKNLNKGNPNHKERADDCGDAYAILTETCMAKMREELETWTDKENDSPLVARHEAARAELGASTRNYTVI